MYRLTLSVPWCELLYILEFSVQTNPFCPMVWVTTFQSLLYLLTLSVPWCELLHFRVYCNYSPFLSHGVSSTCISVVPLSTPANAVNTVARTSLPSVSQAACVLAWTSNTSATLDLRSQNSPRPLNVYSSPSTVRICGSPKNQPVTVFTSHLKNQTVTVFTSNLKNQPVTVFTSNLKNQPVTVFTSYLKNQPVTVFTSNLKNKPV